MAVALFILPEVKSESFSGLLSKNLKPEEEEMVKSNLRLFLDVTRETVTWFREPVVNPVVRCSTMKHLLPLFESPFYRELADRRVDVAIRLIVENSTLPSEILEGLTFMKKCAVKDILPQASGAEDGEIRLQIVTAMVQLLNKLSLFEICEANVEKEKRDASRAMGCLMFKNPFDAHLSQYIIENLKQISPSENGEAVVNLLCKQDEEYVQRTVDFNNAGNLGMEGFSYHSRVGFLADWFNMFRKEVEFDTRNDWICVAELLHHFLNASIFEKSLVAKGELDPFMCGKDRDGSIVMVKVGDDGVISIRGETRSICEHVVTKINTVNEKMSLMI